MFILSQKLIVNFHLTFLFTFSQSMKELEESSKKKRNRKSMDLDEDDLEGASGVRKRLQKGKPDFNKRKFKSKGNKKK